MNRIIGIKRVFDIFVELVIVIRIISIKRVLVIFVNASLRHFLSFVVSKVVEDGVWFDAVELADVVPWGQEERKRSPL